MSNHRPDHLRREGASGTFDGWKKVFHFNTHPVNVAMDCIEMNGQVRPKDPFVVAIRTPELNK